MASGNDQTIHEIFADNDSENEDEFEGFDPENIYIEGFDYFQNIVQHTDLSR
jgi:hypothetical protein